MDLPSPQPLLPWQYLYPSHLLFPYNFIPQNYVHWTQTPNSHIFSADIPGVRKEEIRVEVEDSRYLIIRTELAGDEEEERKFMRKFRIPGRVDLEAISASYENGVLTITVPRLLRRSGFFIHPSDVPDTLELLARAA
ncbi:15.4 kDa class V heat shock protein [Senna tora]|uniref:15.4 kDa class V heat shock protein n=1 Tax=Senna tora TaxID=362788 RepID=A0A834XA97_9FABA|nr:15.4 kDa class V heat shock protein [Senna tora]